MIGARVQVVNEDGSFTTVVCAVSLREVEQTAKAAASISLFDTRAQYGWDILKGIRAGSPGCWSIRTIVLGVILSRASK